MNIPVIDGSAYLRGLLLLIRKDRKVSDEEKSLMRRIGKNLGFEADFMENAIREILDNRHISAEPPVFVTPGLAGKFLKDGLALAFADRDIHPHEERWLLSVARSNGIEERRVWDEKMKIFNNSIDTDRLEVDSLKVIF